MSLIVFYCFEENDSIQRRTTHHSEVFQETARQDRACKENMGGVNVSVWVLVSVCFLFSFFLLGRTVRRVGRKTQKRDKMFALKDSLMNI